MMASATQVTFECPSLQAGAPLDISVEANGRRSNSIQTKMEELGPGIFTIDEVELGRGAVMDDRTALIAVKAPDVEGTASRSGDMIHILSTGLGQPFGDGKLSALPTVTVGGVSAPVLSVTRIQVGVYQIGVEIPHGATIGDKVPVEIQVPSVTGKMVTSNQVYISVERADESE
jgi:uncharacterized protein (TIGR03437 family)